MVGRLGDRRSGEHYERERRAHLAEHVYADATLGRGQLANRMRPRSFPRALRGPPEVFPQGVARAAPPGRDRREERNKVNRRAPVRSPRSVSRDLAYPGGQGTRVKACSPATPARASEGVAMP
jgi:hypothetical protein